ncbi:hypothetical protein ABKV19_010800 [Rosa sericea]
MEERRLFHHRVFQRSQPPNGGGWGEDRVLIALKFYKVRAIEPDIRMPISYEEFSLIAERGITVKFSDIKRSSNENYYTQLISESLSSMGVPHVEHPAILQKLFAVVAAAVSTNNIVVGVWDTSYLGVGDVDGDGDGDGDGDRDGSRSIPKLIPASNSSIEGLEQVTLLDDVTTIITHTPSCAICLEDFAAFEVNDQQEEPITGLPCRHHYHVHCIVQWLEFNHLCPICRYPMPTDDDHSD